MLDDRFTGNERFMHNVSLTDAFAVVDTLFFPVYPVDVKTFSGHPVEAATGHICQKLVRVFMVKLVQKMQLLEVQVQV